MLDLPKAGGQAACQIKVEEATSAQQGNRFGPKEIECDAVHEEMTEAVMSFADSLGSVGRTLPISVTRPLSWPLDARRLWWTWMF